MSIERFGRRTPYRGSLRGQSRGTGSPAIARRIGRQFERDAFVVGVAAPRVRLQIPDRLRAASMPRVWRVRGRLRVEK